MKDVTKFPHATGTAPVPHVTWKDDPVSWAQQQSFMAALADAEITFKERYDRKPEWDIVRFRGCFSTVTTVVELWEEA